MKWNYAIFNPPYQKTLEGTSDMPVYNYFMDAAETIADKVETITPARFLFNAGKTPKEWNQKKLQDEHFKVLDFNIDSKEVFPNTDIKGGVVISYHDSEKTYEPLMLYSPYPQMQSMYQKIRPDLEANGNLSHIMVLQNKFDLDALYADHPEMQKCIGSDGKEKRLVSSCFEKYPVFSKDPVENGIQILGIINISERVYRWIDRKYISDNGNLYKYKVLLPKTNGSGALGEVLSTPLIGTPLIGYTQSFIGIGGFETEQEAENALKYVKTKFCRAALGLLKITQDNSPEKWKCVPIQDFSSSSDIDWSGQTPEIDKQLYVKYALSQEEVDFIEKHVKAMG